MRQRHTFLVLTTATLAIAGLTDTRADAATTSYRAVLSELNDSGVSGAITFTRNSDAETLRVQADISGLTPSLPHVNHIHGRFDENGTPRNSVVPTSALDEDGDGLVEVLEALPAYGDILLSLESSLAGNSVDPSAVHTGPVADADGTVSYDMLFDLTNPSIFFSPVSGADYDADDLFPLDLREYVIHGAFVPLDTFNTEDGFFPVDGTVGNGMGYSATLPVAAAQLAPVPLPAGALLLLTGMAGLGAARSRRKAA